MRRLLFTGLVALGSFIGSLSHQHVTSKDVIQVQKAPIVEMLVPRETVWKWEKVAICETGTNWTLKGPIYSGALGIKNINWKKFGGTKFALSAGDATPQEQIYIAQKIENSRYVPDQYGCGRGW